MFLAVFWFKPVNRLASSGSAFSIWSCDPISWQEYPRHRTAQECCSASIHPTASAELSSPLGSVRDPATAFHPVTPASEANNSRRTKAAPPKGLPDIHGWRSQCSPSELFLVVTQHLMVKKCMFPTSFECMSGFCSQPLALALHFPDGLKRGEKKRKTSS